jgi:hypothetical protein
MTRPASLPFSAALALGLAFLAAACSATPFGDSRPAPAPAAAPAAPPVAMAGRWRLASAAGGACAMTFTAAAASEGTIAPEGGCPANFFTSRRWVFAQGMLVIQDHNRKPLASLRHNAGRSEGEIANREFIWLER